MLIPRSRRLTAWLSRAPKAAFSGYAVAAAFCTYFCMYAFRKPFAAGSYQGEQLFDTGIDLKTALVIGQIVGYTLSKFLGIRVCSEISRDRRAVLLLALIGASELALLLFALVPGDARVFAMFLNGLPLGMIWGLVVSYLEGRRTSEILLVGLSCSFILASGVVKDVGRFLMSSGSVPEPWMPFATGLVFAPGLVVAVIALEQLPPPSADDEAARVRREPMDGARRWAFLKHFFPGLSVLFVVYLFFTAYRDFRDNYGVEIFAQLGFAEEPGIFSTTELPVAFAVLVSISLLYFVRDNRRGLIAVHALMGAGAVLMIGSTLLLDSGVLGGVGWMICVGLGSYLVYVPYNSVLFDRLVAATGVVATAVFAIYVADALGYTGSVAVQLYRDLAHSDSDRLTFFRGFTYFCAVLALVGLSLSAWYFTRRPQVTS